VRYSDWLRQHHPDLNVPLLEGISYGGVLSVVYSRYGLGSAWDGFERPYSQSYSPTSALRIGANVLVYALTH
jgi:hypothetical protein